MKAALPFSTYAAGASDAPSALQDVGLFAHSAEALAAFDELQQASATLLFASTAPHPGPDIRRHMTLAGPSG